MKNNLFFVASEQRVAKVIAAKVAEFFAMRLFDSIEMFEFDHAPRKIDEVIDEFGIDYVKKEMKSIAKMQLDFDEAVFVADIRFLDALEDLYVRIQTKNLVVFLNDKHSKLNQNIKLNFLSDCCDIAVDVSDLSDEIAFSNVVSEIKAFYNIEV